MPDSASHLPENPSLEQLHKQAKELLAQYRDNDPAAIQRFRSVKPDLITAKLADAQFVLAREYGFESWAKLKHHIEELRPPGMDRYESLAQEVAAAYTAGNAMALREVNWKYGTSFVCDFHDPLKMHRRLTTWYAAENRTPELALGDARGIVAHFYGFSSWAEFAQSLAQNRTGPRGPAAGPARDTPLFYRINWKENSISVHGPMSAADWETVASVIAEHKIATVHAGGMTDEGMERISRLEHITRLNCDGSMLLTDDGLAHLQRLPGLVHLDISGWKGQLTDRGLDVLRHLRGLQEFKMCWQQHLSDAGLSHLASCPDLENVNLMGTPTGDATIAVLAGKRTLRKFNTGRLVTDAGLALLHGFPAFKTWQGGEVRYGLMGATSGPTRLMVDGPFTDAGLAGLVGLDGVFGLNFFWHCSEFTGNGLEPLRHLPHLGFLGCEGERCTDDAMRHIAAMPGLHMLMAQGTVASDAGFAALSRSQTIEFIWGRECPNLGSRGFAALAEMPALRGLAVSCKNVDDAALSLLPRFPSLTQFMPMDVPDEGFRHVGAIAQLERLWCMYCRDTGDAATEHLTALKRLKVYYAGQTEITDRSLEILSRLDSLEKLEFWACPGITDAGVARLARLPNLQEISLDGLAGVSRDAQSLFPPHVQVSYFG
jgi:hypothetical protein